MWKKKQVSKTEIETLHSKYDLDALTASILARRNLTTGKELLYFLEDDLRFQHSPFSFNSMEDAVDRILQAKEENEKVLIFGDRDVDGVTSTTVLYDCLKKLGIDVRFRLPSGDDAYGLSIQAVDDFEKEFGSLIITVDCGISNNREIAHAVSKGMDVIVTDHHNPPEELPENCIIVNPKIENSGYPFKDISGCAVAYKIASALRFSESPWYKTEATLLNVRPVNEAYTIECIKIRNLVPVSRLDETIVPGTISISQTRLPSYLQGQAILVWDKSTTEKLMKQVFGNAAEFSFLDIREEVAKLYPSLGDCSLLKIKDMSTIAKYGNHPSTEIGGFYNIYVTYVQQSLKKMKADFAADEEKDLQLVAIAALADIMPMKNENRIFVKKGLASMNAGRLRGGLLELLSKLGMLGRRLTSTDLSWNVVSNLNAAGRLGQPELAARLFISESAEERDQTAQAIIELNRERKNLTVQAGEYAAIQAQASVEANGHKLCTVFDSRINRGVCGLLAGKLVSMYDIPAMVVTVTGDTAIGSMRSCRGFDLTGFLNSFSDLFINHGGHNFAAGFSLPKDRLDEFQERVRLLAPTIELSDSEKENFDIDAQIPESYLTPELLNLSDRLEPYGEENPPLTFMAQNLYVNEALTLGKGEKQHLKLIVSAKGTKWPCLFWNEAERLNRDFSAGDRIDILFHVERNVFNRMEIPQLILLDLKKSAT